MFQNHKENLAFLTYFNGNNSFLFVNVTKVYQFKAQNSEIKPYPLCLGNISRHLTANNMKKQDEINTCKTFLLIIILLIIVILSIFTIFHEKHDIK